MYSKLPLGSRPSNQVWGASHAILPLSSSGLETARNLTSLYLAGFVYIIRGTNITFRRLAPPQDPQLYSLAVQKAG
jgi:hypothetical protein